MRILFVNSGLRFGGAETQMIGFIRELRATGHDVVLFLLTCDAPRLGELEGAGVTVHVDDKKGKFDWGVIRRLRGFIRTWRPDVVHGFLFDANLYARVAAIGLRVPVLNAERNSGYRLRPLQRLVHYPTRGLADGVVANSFAGARLARALFGLPDNKVHVVWNGVDADALRAKAQLAGPDYRQEFFGDSQVWMATLVGTISEQKDYLLALKVAERLSQRDSRWRVAFVGASFGEKLNYDNAAAAASMRYAESVRMHHDTMFGGDRVRFVGQRSDAVRIIAQSDVLFSTSVHEGFPNVVLEAMTVGTPVVSTEYSDIRLILPNPWQVIVDRDADRIALAIEKARQQRDAVGREQQLWVQANATMAMATASLLEVYSGYASRSPDVPPSTPLEKARA